MSFCFLYNVVSENHSVQNSPWGGGGGGSIVSSRSICTVFQRIRSQDKRLLILKRLKMTRFFVRSI